MISKERFELTLQQIKDSVAPDYVGPRGWGSNERGCIVHEIMKRHGLLDQFDRPDRPLACSFEEELARIMHSMIRMNDNGVRWHSIIDWAMQQKREPEITLYSKPPKMDYGCASDPLVKEEELVNA